MPHYTLHIHYNSENRRVIGRSLTRFNFGIHMCYMTYMNNRSDLIKARAPPELTESVLCNKTWSYRMLRYFI